MSYLKPQSPLRDKTSGDYFYPLTTEDFINFSDAGYYNTYGATTDTQCNNKLIPYQIYGISGI